MPAGFQVLYSPKHGWMRPCIQTPILGVNLALLRICHRGDTPVAAHWPLVPVHAALVPGDYGAPGEYFPGSTYHQEVFMGHWKSEPSGGEDIPGTGTVSVQGGRWVAVTKPQALYRGSISLALEGGHKMQRGDEQSHCQHHQPPNPVEICPL